MSAVLAPLPGTYDVSRREFCDMLGINRQAKYVKSGFDNRRLFNEFLALDERPLAVGETVSCEGFPEGIVTKIGEDGHVTIRQLPSGIEHVYPSVESAKMTRLIKVGERVSCRASPEGILTEIGDDGSVLICLLPLGNEKRYPSTAAARMTRFEPLLDVYDRSIRFDTTSEFVKKKIENFYRTHVPISPNKQDVVRKRHKLYPSQFEEKQAMFRNETIDELWTKFLEEQPETATNLQDPARPNTAPMIFRTNAPWEMRKARDSGCLCKDCESFHALRRGVTGACASIDKIVERIEAGSKAQKEKAEDDLVLLRSIKDVIATPSKYDTIVACLQPCLTTNKLEDAKPDCIDGHECTACGFRRLWSDGLRKSLMSEESTIIQASPLAGNEWTVTGIDWRYYTSIAKPTVASHAENVARQASIARGKDGENGDGDYGSAGSSSARTLCLATKRGTLVDFLDAFEAASEKHAYHRNLVSTERLAQVTYDKNVRPLIVKRDIDFSENGTIKNKQQIQSQYWVTIGYTLFVSIACWIEAAEWDKTSGLLAVGSEVTSFGEFSGEQLNLNSFWATVTKVLNADEGLYEVTDAKGVVHTINRSDLRNRRRHSVACGHVTDDKVHDRRAMQHFTDHELKYLESYMKENFPADLPKGNIVRLHQHSDNAGSHFKNTGAINYYTTLINDRGGPAETSFVYSFGAPGHGKGPYDGIGGRWKRKIDQCMATAEEENLAYTSNGSIENVKDVYDALEYHFGRAEKRDRNLAGKNPIHHYKFFCYEFGDENPIQRPDESFTTLQGISKHYQFSVKKEGVVFMRMRSCFCLTCMKDFMDGPLDWNDSHRVSGCDATANNIASDPASNMYCFHKSECSKLTGPGVQKEVQISKRNRNETASSLSVGDWVLFDGHDDEVEPIWLGRVMSNPEWEGQGVSQNNTSRIVSYSSGVKV